VPKNDRMSLGARLREASGQGPALEAIEGLEERVAAMIAVARAAWPAVAVDDEVFVRYVAARLPEVEGDDPFAGLRTEDLLLACGCVAGDPGAVRAFEEVFGPDIAAVARRYRGLPVDADDVLQLVREKLLVAGAGGAPKLADYAGIGFLQNWVRVAAVRTFLDAGRRRGARPEVADDEALMAVADPDDDVELAYLKRHYRAEFRAAFSEAVAGLESRERNALRQHLVGGLTIDQMAALYGIHRATAARRVAAARSALLAATRRALATRLRVGDDELGSIMRLINSHLDVSLTRLLHSASAG
jgi:RNA polymerase sigma-70 factor, ECF subfamily